MGMASQETDPNWAANQAKRQDRRGQKRAAWHNVDVPINPVKALLLKHLGANVAWEHDAQADTYQRGWRQNSQYDDEMPYEIRKHFAAHGIKAEDITVDQDVDGYAIRITIAGNAYRHGEAAPAAGHLGVHVAQQPSRREERTANAAAAREAMFAAHNARNAALRNALGDEGFVAALRQVERTPVRTAPRPVAALDAVLDAAMRAQLLGSKWKGVGGASTDHKCYVPLGEKSIDDIRASVKRVLGGMNVQAKIVNTVPNNDALAVVCISAKTFETLETQAKQARGR